ncbi:YrhB domain-containing protein [Roseibium suaedae]|uniref:Immunity protein 35 n=1 Tax=Roseibium suaedae TaxID=735517 RepID=A0A1M7P8C9_9HYPH|nr:YrhB domain-containing protein [Roseibium suaedae]SHN12932.1 Immunity protein 35 [Roseibium suaedae]
MVNINKEKAIQLAQKIVDQYIKSTGIDSEIISDIIEEIDRGWVFFYNSSEYLRTGSFSSQLLGNGPIFVTREGGVHELTTSEPWDEAIKKIR